MGKGWGEELGEEVLAQVGEPRHVAQVSLLSSRCADLLVCFVPAIVASIGAQGEHRIDVAGSPVHPGSLEASLHHRFVAAFHDA